MFRTPRPVREPSRRAVASRRRSMVRFKNRYLVLEVAREDARALEESGKERAVLDALLDATRDCFGDVGAGTQLRALSVRYVDALTGVCVVRCAREGGRAVRAACAATREVGGRRCACAVTHCGGTTASAVAACERRIGVVLDALVASGRVRAEEREGLMEARRRVLTTAVSR